MDQAQVIDILRGGRGWEVIMKIKAVSPYAVENISAREDSDVQVKSQNVVERTNFLHITGICEGLVTNSFWK